MCNSQRMLGLALPPGLVGLEPATGSGNDTVGTAGCPLGCSRLAVCSETQARSRTMASPSGRKPTSVR